MDGQDDIKRLYDALAPRLYRYALMVLVDPAGAEDAVQQAFVKYATGRQDRSPVENSEGYLRIAVRNECWRLLKRRGNRREIALQSARLLEAVEAPLADEDEQRALERALRSLPVEQREVVHLKVYEGMTFQRIADLLAIPQNTAASRYRYGIEKLRLILDPDSSRKDSEP